MMKIFILVALAVCAVHAVVDDKEISSEWEKFKTKFSRSYNAVEEVKRRGIFADNYRNYMKHNEEFAQGLHTYRKGVNQFTDLTSEEWRATYLGVSPPRKTGPTVAVVGDAPKEIDWRTKNAVTGIKDQGQCGSCWTFSAAAAIEGAHAIATKNLVSLSEQNILDCVQEGAPVPPDPCPGGLMDDAFKWIASNGGIDTEESYPYQAAPNPSCQYNAANKGASITGYQDIDSGDEKSLTNAIGTIGPISVAFDATDNFQGYQDGVFSDDTCQNDQNDLDHGITAVGYGKDGDQEFYLVKNSWGDSWGEKGYIRVARNANNMCGIATMASYPTGAS